MIIGPRVGNIQYWYADAPESAASDVRRDVAALSGLVDSCSDPVKKKKMEEALAQIASLMTKINRIPSSGIRDMLFAKLTAAISELAKGNVDIALTALDALSTLVDKCANLIDHIQNNIHKLRSSLSVQGPAGGLLKAIAEAAQLALNGASSLVDLERLQGLTDRACELGDKLSTTKVGSRDYAEYTSQLASILDELLSMNQRAGDTVDINGAGNGADGGKMDGDSNQVSQGGVQLIVTGINQLMNGTTDSLKQRQLGALQGNLIEAQVGAQKAGLSAGRARELVEGGLRLAAEGKLDEALVYAQTLSLQIAQMQEIQGHLDKRFGLAEREGAHLTGMNRKRHGEALVMIATLRSLAGTPEALHHVDRLLSELLAVTSDCGCDSATRRLKGQNGLRKLISELETAMLKAVPPAVEGRRDPFGKDCYKDALEGLHGKGEHNAPSPCGTPDGLAGDDFREGWLLAAIVVPVVPAVVGISAGPTPPPKPGSSAGLTPPPDAHAN